MRESHEGIAALRRSGWEKFEERLLMDAELPAALASSPVAGETLATGSNGTPGANSQLTYVRQTYGLTGSGQTVAVIDTGIAWDHVALGGGFGSSYRVVGGWDFTEENDANPYDDGPAGLHGTHVAGIIGANSGSQLGVAPDVDLVALRVVNDMGDSNFGWLERSLRWVHEHRHDFENPITTVNISLGIADSRYTAQAMAQIDDELATLYRDGIFVVAAAGNDFRALNAVGLSYPASSTYVTAAGSVGSSGALSGFSQRISGFLAAPGEAVVSTVPDYAGNNNFRADDYLALSGTSMAAPYLAGAGVLVRQALQRVGATQITPDAIARHLLSTADRLVDATTGITYHRVNVANAIDTLMAQALEGGGSGQTTGGGTSGGAAGEESGGQGGSNQTQVVNPVSWGRLVYGTFEQAQVTTGARFDITAGNSGLFTIVADADSAFTFDLVDSAGRSLGTRTAAAGTTRIDFEVRAGESFQLRIVEGNTRADFTLVNLVRMSGRQVVVDGSAGDDTFEVGTAGSRYVSVNGVRYNLGSNITDMVFNASEGEDHLTIIGSSASETVTARPDRLDWRRAGLAIRAGRFEHLHVIGGGGADTANLFDSAGDDLFTASPTSASLSGDDFEFVVSGFQRVTAIASTGNDRARLTDSLGDDTFVGQQYLAYLSGRGYSLAARQFDRVDAVATGGKDRALLYDSLGNDTFVASPTKAEMRGTGFHNAAENFDFVAAYARRGNDTAHLTGSAGNDLFTRRGTSQTLVGSSFTLVASGFRGTEVFGGGGYDRATLHDLGMADLLRGAGNQAVLTGSSGHATLSDFDFISARARSGQTARAQMQPVDYVFEKLGRWA